MAYIKTTWTNKRPPSINASNLNHIEEGIYNAHEAIAAVQNFKYVAADTLPTASSETMGKIYLIPKSGSTTIKEEWITLENDEVYSWLKIGETEITLSDYYTKSEIDDLLATKQEILISGTNIKTINLNSILGEGNIHIESGSEGGTAHIL